MEKLIEMLVQSNLLNESTIATVRTEVEQLINEAKAVTEAEVKATLTEQWIAERELLVESLDAKLTDLLEGEIADLKDDIKSFRDLEVEYATKLENEKVTLTESYENKFEQLIETLDTFIESRLAVELQEFASDLEQVKQNQFATELFETFAPKFQERFLSQDETHRKLQEAQAQLHEAQAQLKNTQMLQETAQRTAKMTELLSTLGDKQRGVMTTLLEGVATDQLTNAFNRYIDVVISQSTKKPEAKTTTETAPLNEGAVIVHGNKTPVLNTNTSTENSDPAERVRLRKLAGLD